MVGFTTAVVVEHNGLTVIYYFMFTHAPTYAHTHKHTHSLTSKVYGKATAHLCQSQWTHL